jgi:hypothetical protein
MFQRFSVRRTMLIAGAIALASPLASCSKDLGTTSTANRVELLYVQMADSASLDTQSGTLTLTGVGADTIWFTDRPSRSAGTSGTADFVDKALPAAQSSPDGPPNAALVWRDNGADQVMAVELVSGTYDKATATIVYQVNVIAERPDGVAGFHGFAEPPADPVGPAWLFIDNLFQSSTCELRVYNKTTATYNQQYGIARVPPGNSWYYRDSGWSGCTGDVYLMGLNATRTEYIAIAHYAYDDPKTGSNSAQFYCSASVVCAEQQNDSDATLAESLWICPAGTKQCGDPRDSTDFDNPITIVTVTIPPGS